MSQIPGNVSAQLVEKSKTKDVTLGFKQDSNKTDFLLEVYDSPTSKFAKSSYNLRRALSELKTQDVGLGVLILITTEQEVTFKFKNPQDAVNFHRFICEKSEVQAENKAISQLDDEMRMIWPFPGGSFF